MKMIKICRNDPVTCTHRHSREHSPCEKKIHPACRLEYEYAPATQPYICFTSSAQGTLPSTKSYKALHTKASTDSRFQTAPAENPDFKSSEYFRKQGKHKLEPRKLRKITQGYKPTPVPAGLQQIRCLPAWFQGLQVPNSSISERKGCSPFSGMLPSLSKH